MNFIDFIIQNKIHELLIYIILGITTYAIIKKIILKKTKKTTKRQQTIKKLLVNIIKYIIIILLLLKTLTIFGIDVTSIIAGLGIASVVIGLALQDIMKDILSGMFIIIENQYDIDDEVKINNYQGTVVELGLRATKIKTFENNIVSIANRNISEVTNYSKEKQQILMTIPMPYDVSNKKALKVLNNIKQRTEKEIDTLTTEVNILGIQEFASSAINYRISLTVKTNTRYETQRKINMLIKEEYDKEQISIPYNIIEVKNANKDI